MIGHLSIGMFFAISLFINQATLIADTTVNKESESSEKYRDVFYPNGMPIRKNILTDKDEKTTYSFYDEKKLPEANTIIVLYSEKIGTDNSSESIHKVYLGVIHKTGNSYEVKHVRDLTEFVPVYLEVPGQFLRMDGRINVFPISKGDWATHINIWSILSGTGFGSGASDIFFKVTADSKLELILNLKQTSKFWRIGTEELESKDSNIFIADTDDDNTQEVIVEERQRSEKDGKTEFRTQDLSIYKFNGKNYEFIGKAKKATLIDKIKRGHRLERSKFIPMVEEK